MKPLLQKALSRLFRPTHLRPLPGAPRHEDYFTAEMRILNPGHFRGKSAVGSIAGRQGR